MKFLLHYRFHSCNSYINAFNSMIIRCTHLNRLFRLNVIDNNSSLNQHLLDELNIRFISTSSVVNDVWLRFHHYRVNNNNKATVEETYDDGIKKDNRFIFDQYKKYSTSALIMATRASIAKERYEKIKKARSDEKSILYKDESLSSSKPPIAEESISSPAEIQVFNTYF